MDFEKSFDQFSQTLQESMNKYYGEHHPKSEVPQMSFETGKRYIRIVRESYGSRSCYGFIDMTNGDILMSATWKAPAKHKRGSIFSDVNGMECCTPYGITYINKNLTGTQTFAEMSLDS